MQTVLERLSIALFLVLALIRPVGAQQTAREFQIAHAPTANHPAELANAIRAIVETDQVTVDPRNTITVRGTAAQLAMASWLMSVLDAAPNGQHSSPPEFRALDAFDDVARVLFFAHTPTLTRFNEVATVILATSQVRRRSTVADSKAFVVRGTGFQVALAEWLFNELDKPAIIASQHTASEIYHYAGGGVDHVTRVYYLANAGPVIDFQTISTAMRVITEVRYTYTYNDRRALIMRGSTKQIALADWLTNELDQLNDAARPASSREYETGIGADVVRVFYVKNSGDVEDFQRTVMRAGVLRAASYRPQQLLTLRGTRKQIEVAEKAMFEQGYSGRSVEK
jgi:hypothetical protein